jgi:hypothetical protein
VAGEPTVLVGILPGLAPPEDMTIGAWWQAPTAESLLVVGLVASSHRRPSQVDRRRWILISLIGLGLAAEFLDFRCLSVTNTASFGPGETTP